MPDTGQTLDRIGQVGRRLTSHSIGFLKKSVTSLSSNRKLDGILIEDTRLAPVPAVTPLPAKKATVISANVELTGAIVTPDELRIYGKVEGNLRASIITICASGSVKGEVIAETVVVMGTVDGRIHGEKVQLLAGATVRGDIVHGALGVDLAATFEGASRRNPNAMAAAPAVKAAPNPAPERLQASPSQ